MRIIFDKIIKTINDNIANQLVKEAVSELPDVTIAKSALDKCHRALEHEITKVVSQIPSATWELDPITTRVVKECPALIPWITDIVNLSLANSIAPSDMKKAVITPYIKKISLDPAIYRNFRPVSN